MTNTTKKFQLSVPVMFYVLLYVLSFIVIIILKTKFQYVALAGLEFTV